MPPVHDAPIPDEALGDLFGRVSEAGAIALAVSGGKDSLALLHLCHRWRALRGAGPAIRVLAVDHGLRPGSAAEARAVAAHAGRLGLAAEVLVWEGPKPSTGVEEAAREARYRLMTEAALVFGASWLLTGHHRDDQAETVLLRLGRGSGAAGLGAMRAERRLAPGLTLFRPFLGLPSERLAATVWAAGLRPAEDETNRDARFARGRLRAVMPLLAAEGLSAEGLARTAARLGRANDALDHYAVRLLADAVSVDRLATARLDRPAFAAAPLEVRLRVLARVLLAVGGGDRPPGGERLEDLAAAIAAPGRARRTLAGVVASVDSGSVTFHRELRRGHLPVVVVAGRWNGVWDGRFAVAVAAPREAGLSVGPLGEQGRIDIGATGRGITPGLAALPALRQGREIVAVPALGYAAGRPDISVEARCLVGERLGLSAST